MADDATRRETSPEVGSSALRCDFCAHRCLLAPGKTGLCGVRRRVAGEENRSDRIVTTVYGQVQAAATDRIEKKPLYHFLPGTTAFSLALGGCNFRCRFCQNEHVAFADRLGPPVARWSPDDVVVAWRRSGAPTIAYTYTEPGVWQDYLLESALPAREEGARIVMVTNGYLTPEAVERLLPVVDGFNIDLKGDDRFYRTLCRGTFEPVIDTIRRIAPHRHLEVTTMLMERFHDRATLEMLREQLAFAGVSVWHLSRFHPAGMMLDESATSEEFLSETLREVTASGDDSIPFIYAGNTGNRDYQRTFCPKCGTLCVDRAGFVNLYTVHGRCPGCGHHLYGVFHQQ